MLLTTTFSNFSNCVHELQLHNSGHFNHNFQEFNSIQTHHVPKTNSINIKFDLCIMNINGITEIEIWELNRNFNDHFVEMEVFHLICSNSHYDSYPNLFNKLNSFDNNLIVPLYMNTFPENRGVV